MNSVKKKIKIEYEDKAAEINIDFSFKLYNSFSILLEIIRERFNIDEGINLALYVKNPEEGSLKLVDSNLSDYNESKFMDILAIKIEEPLLNSVHDNTPTNKNKESGETDNINLTNILSQINNLDSSDIITQSKYIDLDNNNKTIVNHISKKLTDEVPIKEPNKISAVPFNVKCCICHGYIYEKMFSCTICENLSFCLFCESKHPPTHPLIMFKTPPTQEDQEMFGIMNKVKSKSNVIKENLIKLLK